VKREVEVVGDDDDDDPKLTTTTTLFSRFLFFFAAVGGCRWKRTRRMGSILWNSAFERK
jgi:hypothetical protein